MDAQLKAAVEAGIFTEFTAVEILLPEYDLRLVDGGFVIFDVSGVPQTFTSKDATYGALGAVDPINDGVEEKAISARITLLPPTDAAVAALAAPQTQGSSVRVWFGAVDPATGLSVGEPEELFAGELDYATLKVGGKTRMLTLQCGSDDEFQLEPDAQKRLSHPYHSDIWPGENGLKHVTNVTRQIYWRLAEPRRSVSPSGGAGGGGGVSNPGAVIR